jgi:cytochrome c biogenesis protein ResB
MQLFRRLASLKLTLFGMVLLAIGAGATYDNRFDVTVWVLVVPLAILAINLTAAILTNPRINRQSGLLLFHLGLLGIVILAAIGRMSRLDAHVEMVQGQPFAPEKLLEIKMGPLHDGSLDRVHFVQGPYTVDYAPGMKRGLTHSEVFVPDNNGNLEPRDVGDDRPLVIEGYRFYTTFNKGFAVLLTWIPNDGVPISGTVNLPSYPLFEYKQDNSWTPPGSSEIKFWLQLQTGMDENAAWRLDGRNSKGTLVVTSQGERFELKEGQVAQLAEGRLKYERLLTWMGYKVFYDPTLKWLFFVSIVAVFGLGWHFWQKMATQPWPEGIKTAGKQATEENLSQKRDLMKTS